MTVPLSTLFDVQYGNKLDANKMAPVSPASKGVNFVGRSSRNHGITGRVADIPGLKPYKAGCITVALGGSKLLSSFVQLQDFYTAQNVAVLTPKADMSLAEKLYICLCIRHNRFRYSAFGREANRTLRSLHVPSIEEFPAWVKDAPADLSVKKYLRPAVQGDSITIDSSSWQLIRLVDIFDIVKGTRLTQANMSSGTVPFVAAIDKNNGVRQMISAKAKHKGNLITVSYNGSVGEVFYQPEPFFASDDVNVLYPKFSLSEAVGLFLCAVLRREAYRFSYGRKWTIERMRETTIRLPCLEGVPDWTAMEQIMQLMPGSGALLAGDAEKSVV
ncbi:restriction endonuclease subunit S [uncultured Sphingomonas sp.]|uniref:restriction endonuclease subunit S n=1 Tax=uncultured Sphingomonas sp. TaxID=158754 RepID=UPI0025D75FFB|nr:restriction endonuclease subunit S [uncultured Sphingomonas sp.]